MLNIFETQDGSSSVFSEKFGEGYHSKYGAVQESRHVFIEEGLFLAAILKKELSILEMGFGTGLNVLLTYLEAKKLNLSIRYTGVDAYPLEAPMYSQLNHPQMLGLAEEQPVFDQIHQSPWNTTTPLTDFFSLRKIRERFEQVEFTEPFDLIYYDAFAPSAQPELWEAPLMQKLYDSLLPGGVMVTYCASGAFKRTLKSVGFEVQTLKGPPGKREMTRAVR